MTDFLKLSKEAFDASSAYMDTNWRADLDYSLRAFRNEHASTSKYSSPEYASRSRIFTPKTRAIIRKNEAAAAIALFSNMDVVNVTPINPDDPMSVAAAEADKQLLEYRLANTIKTFPLVMGAFQDAQTQGMVCSYQYWKYQRKNGRLVKDEPCIELRPIENIRIDGGADWLDPVNSSPYFCDIIPMYVCDVKGLMKSVDDKTGQPKWRKFKDEIIVKARPDAITTAANLRVGKQQDPTDERPAISDFDIVWVMRWMMRDSIGDDYTYYTLGTEELLTEAVPLEEAYFHNVRPYVMGWAINETHKPMKTSTPMLIKPLQQEGSDIRNLRLDNVKFVLSKRWLVARGRQVDVQSLVRGVPGGVTLTTDPKTDVVESNWPDVTSSAYVEQDRINSELDDLAGNFSPSTKVANNAVNDTLGGSKMANMSAGIMTDYTIRTFIETWYEPVLKQVLLLERYYETDQNVLRVAAQKAQLWKKYNLYTVTDDLLAKDVNVMVNVGMGSSNPQERFQKSMMFFGAANQLIATAPPGANVTEQIKELASCAGFRDGARFYTQNVDPRLLMAQQTIQKLTGLVEGKQLELQSGERVEQMKLTSNEKVKAAEISVNQARIQGDLQIRAAELVVEQQRLKLEELQLQAELQGADQELRATLIEAGTKIEEAQMKLKHEEMKIKALAVKTAADLAKTETETEVAKASIVNERRIGEVAKGVVDGMRQVGAAFAAIQQQMDDAKSGIGANASEVANIKEGLKAVASAVGQKKKGVKSFKLKKGANKKTNAVVVGYDDGTEQEMPVEAA